MAQAGHSEWREISFGTNSREFQLQLNELGY